MRGTELYKTNARVPAEQIIILYLITTFKVKKSYRLRRYTAIVNY